MEQLRDLSKVDPNIVNKLYDEGAFFVFLDVPIGTEFGIDMKIWNTAEKFKGVKMIPPGIHYIHYSCVNKYCEVGPRLGFFHNFNRQELLIKKWDNIEENLSSETITEDEIQAYKNNLKNLDKHLGCYPYDIYEKWTSLSNHLHENLLLKLSPSCGTIRAAVDLVACKDEDRPRGKIQTVSVESEESRKPSTSRAAYKRDCDPNTSDPMEHLLPKLEAVEGTELRFTKFPDRHYPLEATPSEITFHSLDYSYMLQCLLDCHEKSLDILGEIQFAYICFLVGGNLDAFEHWKRLVGLLCNCQKAITKHSIIYNHLPEVLEIQIYEIPADFLVDIVSSNNFIYVKIKNLFRVINESDVDGIVKSKMCRFQQRLSEKFNWDLDYDMEESDDEKPVIVDVNEVLYSSNTEMQDVDT